MFSTIILFHIFLFGEVSQELGKDSYGKETIESLDVMGTVKLAGTTITKHLKVTGNLIAHDAKIEEMETAGDTQIYHTTCIHKVTATGFLKGVHSKFQDQVTIFGQRAVFSNCTLTNIAMERDFGFKGAQVLELKEKTIIEGDVHFKGGGGKVFLYPGSKVLGKIIGGEIIHKK